MDLRTLISQEEKDIIKYSVDMYAEYSLGCEVDYLLREWNIQKAELFNIFGKELILEKDIEFQKPPTVLSHELNDSIFQMGLDESALNKTTAYSFYNAFRKTFLTTAKYRENFNLYYQLETLIDYYELACGVYEGENFEIPVPNEDKPIKVQKGSKIIRVLGKIAKKFDLPGYEEFRLLHSQILNQKKLKGKLCLSIHPLDYITMSDNDCDWSSCMSWAGNGCYRQGTVEMMNSPMVIVAYLKSENSEMRIGDNYWNSKKWRQLFIVNKEMIGNIKPYPYYNDNLTFEVLKWLKELCDKTDSDLYHNYCDDIIEYNAYEFFDFNGKKLYVSPQTNYMYNDFGSKHYAYFNNDLEDRYNFRYSGLSECMHCGDLDVEVDSEEYLVGTCCYQTYECYNCGERLDESELIEIDGELYCQDCIDNYSYEDPITGCVHMEGTGRRLSLMYNDPKDGLIIDESDSLMFTPSEYSKDTLKRYFNRIYIVGSYYNTRYYVRVSDCTPLGLSAIFGYDSSEEFMEYKEKVPYVVTVDINLDEALETNYFDNFRDGYLSSGYTYYINLK